MVRESANYQENQDKYGFEWKSTVSSWMKAVHQSESFLKKKAFQRFISKTIPKNEIYNAFETHGLLLRGFGKLKRSIQRRRASKHHRRYLLKKCFIHWVVVNSRIDIPIKRRGAMIYACMKWISLTLCLGKPAYFSRWVAIDNELSNRVRHYIFGQLDLPPKNVPLLLHSIAVLDTFILRSCFSGWVKYVKEIVALSSRSKYRKLKQVFLSWFRLSCNMARWRKAEFLINQRRSYLSVRYMFQEWQTIQRSLVYIRTVRQPQQLSRSLRKWQAKRRRANSTKKIIRARSNQYMKSLSGALGQWHQWSRWKLAYSQIKSHAAHHFFLRLLKYLFSKWQQRIYSRVYLRIRYWGLDNRSCAQRCYQWTGCPDTWVVIKRPGGPSSRRGDVCLWLSRHPDVGCVLSTRITHAFLRWRGRVTRCRILISQANAVKEARYSRLLQQTFGAWMLKGVHLMGIKRSANRVVINRFRRILKQSFVSWKDLWDRREQHRRDVKLREESRVKELYRRLELWRRVSAHVTCQRNFLAWKKHSWYAKTGRVMRPRILNYVHKQLVALAFRKWNAASYETVIVCCIQKLWRGYACRHIHFRSQYAHMKWILGGYLRHAMRMCDWNTKRQALSGWLMYVNSHRHARELRSNRVLQMRALDMCRDRVRRLVWQRRGVLHAYIWWSRKVYRMALSTLSKNATLHNRTASFHRRCAHRRLRSAIRVLGSFLPQYAVKPSLVWRRRSNMSLEEGRFAMRRYLLRWWRSARFSVRSIAMLKVSRRFFLSKYVGIVRSWQWRAHRWAKTADHPILMAHAHYIRQLRCKAFRLFRWRLHNLRNSFRGQYRLVSTIERKYNRKRARAALLVWYKMVLRTQLASRLAIRVGSRPVFKAWRRTFLIVRSNRLKIYKVRVKVMRRIAKGVFLAWSLYTLRSSRLQRSCRLLHERTLTSQKLRAWNVWRFARKELLLKDKEDAVFARYAERKRLEILQLWMDAYRISSENTWQNVQTIFNCWARMTEDNQVGRRAHAVGEIHHRQISLRSAMYTWKARIYALQHFRNNEFEGRKAMLMTRCVQALRYWRCWSWWMGRRVLYGRVKLIGFDYQTGPMHETPRTGMMSRIINTPLHTGRSGHHVDFSMSPAYSHSHMDVPTPRRTQSRSGQFELDEEIQRSTVQSSARARAIKRKHFKLSSYLLVKGRTPLAHEASALRALREWRKKVRSHIENKREGMLSSFFHAWRRYCRDTLHRRIALVNRLGSFYSFYMKQFVFATFVAKCTVHLKLRKKAYMIQKKFALKMLHRWQECTKTRHAQKRKKRYALSFLTEVADDSNSKHMRRALQVWKLKTYLAGPAFRNKRSGIMAYAFSFWVKALEARRHRDRVLKRKALNRWVYRRNKIAGARESLLGRQRAATMVRMRFKQVVYQKLQSAFARWLHFMRLSEGHNRRIDEAEEWRSQIAQSRSSSISLAYPPLRRPPSVLENESSPESISRSRRDGDRSSRRSLVSSVAWSPQLESFQEASSITYRANTRTADAAAPESKSRSRSRSRSGSPESVTTSRQRGGKNVEGGDSGGRLSSRTSRYNISARSSEHTTPSILRNRDLEAEDENSPLFSPSSRHARHTPISLSSAGRRGSRSAYSPSELTISRKILGVCAATSGRGDDESPRHQHQYDSPVFSRGRAGGRGSPSPGSMMSSKGDMYMDELFEEEDE